MCTHLAVCIGCGIVGVNLILAFNIKRSWGYIHYIYSLAGIARKEVFSEAVTVFAERLMQVVANQFEK